MRTTKLLIFTLLLIFVIGCNHRGSGGVETSESVITASTSQLESADISNFPPSDWPKKPIITYSEDEGKIVYSEGIYSDRFWTPEGIAFMGQPIEDKFPLVQNKETAAEIASSIFHAQMLVNNWNTENMVVREVFFDTQDKVWIVVFSDPPVSGLAQGTVTMVLRKDNAQVLAIWAEAG